MSSEIFPRLKVSTPPLLSLSSKNGSINQNSKYSTLDCSKSVVLICLVIPAHELLTLSMVPLATVGSIL